MNLWKVKENHTQVKYVLKNKNLDIEIVLEFLRENGAGCDCEVIFNVEEQYEVYT